MSLFLAYLDFLVPQFVQLLFEEVDQDGSGAIDKGEFRMLLRKLNLNYRCDPILRVSSRTLLP